MLMELAACEKTLLAEIRMAEATHDALSVTYAMSIKSSESSRIDWRKVNDAITKRWSASALKYIKGRAWRIVRGELDS